MGRIGLTSLTGVVSRVSSWVFVEKSSEGRLPALRILRRQELTQYLAIHVKDKKLCVQSALSP